MCRRFLSKLPAAEVARLFGTRNPLPNYPARYNIAPTRPGAHRALQSQDQGANARCAGASCRTGPKTSSLAPRQSMPAARRWRRCPRSAMPLLSGAASSPQAFYEWKKLGTAKQPYAIVPTEDQGGHDLAPRACLRRYQIPEVPGSVRRLRFRRSRHCEPLTCQPHSMRLCLPKTKSERSCDGGRRALEFPRSSRCERRDGLARLCSER
jgi:hypothetical protein